MSAYIGSDIIDDGLVFHSDMSNTQKSFLGPARPNLAYTAGNVAWSVVYDATRTTVINNSVYRLTTPSTLPIGVTRMYFDSTKLTNGLTYNLSFKYKIISGNDLVMTDWCDQDLSNIVKRAEGDYIFHSASGTRSAYDNVYSFMDIFIPASTVIEIWDVQLEQNTYATPFTGSTRANTQVLVDLTGNRPITANSLTFNTDRSFRFNGTSDFVTAGALSGPFPRFTVNLWFNSSSVSNFKNPIDCNFNVYPASGNIGPRLEQNSAGTLVWTVSGNTVNNSVADSFTVQSSGLLPNTWYNTTITRNNNGLLSTYLNGNAVVTNASNPAGFVNLFGNVVIGKGFHLGNDRSFEGQIPIVQIYNRALSPTEVFQNYTVQKGRFGL